MPHSDETINYPFLLLTHIVCVDRQIHSEESTALCELADIAKIGYQTQEEMKKILSQDEHYLSFEDIACRVTAEQQNETMRQLLAIAHADGFFAPLEREMVDRIAKLWNCSPQQIDRMIEEAEEFTFQKSDDNTESLSLSFAGRLLKNEKKSALSRAIISMAVKLSPETIGRKIERLEREIL